MEVGLTYLMGEAPGVMTPLPGAGGTVKFTLQVMPLRRADVCTKIYIKRRHWPAFTESGGELSVGRDSIYVLMLSGATLVPA
jgi:hypothetical protein